MAETPNQLTPRTNLGPVGRVLDQFRAFSAIPMVRQLIALASFSGPSLRGENAPRDLGHARGTP